MHNNPDDAAAYLLLGKLYVDLRDDTREGDFTPLELRDIRRAQICGTLQQAVRLNPDLGEAHGLLANQYLQLGYLDLYLRHTGEQIRCIRESPALAAKSGEELAKLIQEQDAQLRNVEAEVKDRQDKFLVRHGKRPPLEQAAFALSTTGEGTTFGLAETAFELLKQIDLKKLGEENPAALNEAVSMLLNVRFLLGTLEEIREGVKQDVDSLPGEGAQSQLPAIEWSRLRLAAVSGDYAEADEILKKRIEQVAAINNGPGVAQILSTICLHDAVRTSAGSMGGPLTYAAHGGLESRPLSEAQPPYCARPRSRSEDS